MPVPKYILTPAAAGQESNIKHLNIYQSSRYFKSLLNPTRPIQSTDHKVSDATPALSTCPTKQVPKYTQTPASYGQKLKCTRSHHNSKRVFIPSSSSYIYLIIHPRPDLGTVIPQTRTPTNYYPGKSIFLHLIYLALAPPRQVPKY